MVGDGEWMDGWVDGWLAGSLDDRMTDD